MNNLLHTQTFTVRVHVGMRWNHDDSTYTHTYMGRFTNRRTSDPFINTMHWITLTTVHDIRMCFGRSRRRRIALNLSIKPIVSAVGIQYEFETRDFRIRDWNLNTRLMALRYYDIYVLTARKMSRGRSPYHRRYYYRFLIRTANCRRSFFDPVLVTKSSCRRFIFRGFSLRTNYFVFYFFLQPTLHVVACLSIASNNKLRLPRTHRYLFCAHGFGILKWKSIVIMFKRLMAIITVSIDKIT